MKKVLAVLAAAAMLTACDSIPADNANSTTKTEHHEGDGHDHDHADHDHADGAAHDHGHEHADGHEHGEHHELGSATAAGISFEAHQLGHGVNDELAVEIVLGKDSPKPKAIRGWIGNQAAEGSMKTRAEGSGPVYELHLELLDSKPEGAQIWIEMEAQDGSREAKSFNIVPDTE